MIITNYRTEMSVLKAFKLPLAIQPVTIERVTAPKYWEIKKYRCKKSVIVIIISIFHILNDLPHFNYSRVLN